MLDIKEWLIIYRYWKAFRPNCSFITVIMDFTYWCSVVLHINASKLNDEEFYILILEYFKTLE